MSKSPTPKGTPVQRSPSDGVSEGLQSPQHSTPSIGPQHKKRISSLLQSPVRRLLASDLFFFFTLSLSRPLSALWMRLSPPRWINLVSNAMWQLGLQPVLDLRAEWLCVLLHMGGQQWSYMMLMKFHGVIVTMNCKDGRNEGDSLNIFTHPHPCNGQVFIKLWLCLKLLWNCCS